MSVNLGLHGIRNRMIAAVALLQAVLIGLVVHDMVQRERTFLVEQTSNDGRALARTLAVNAAEWLLIHDLTALGELTDSLSEAGGVRYALVMDRGGRVRASSDPQMFNLVLDDAASRRIIGAMENDPARDFHQTNHDRALDTIAAITAHGRRIGYARVVLDLGATEAELGEVTRRGLLFALAAIVGGAIVAWLVMRRVSGGLDRLSAAARAISQGNLSPDLPPTTGSDEVAELARAFSQMARSLEQDATRRQAAEQALRESEARNRLLATAVEQSNDSIITRDLNGVITSWNRGAERVFGFTAAEAIGRPCNELHMANLAPEAYRAFIDGMRSGKARTYQVKRRARDGRIIWVDASAAPLYDANGTHVGEIGIARDITELREAEEALRRSEAHSRLLAMVVEQSEDAITTKDLDGVITSWNRGAERLYGFSADEAVGQTSRELQMSHFSDEQYAAVLARIRSGKRTSFEGERITKSGDRVNVSVSTTPLYDDEGRHIGEIAISHDVTGLKRAEAALFAEKERAEVTLQSIGDGVITAGVDGRVEYLNPVAESLTGWGANDAGGRPLAEVFAVRDELTGEPLPDPVERVLREGRILELSSRTLLLARDGREVPIQDSAAPIRDRDGKTVGVVLVFSDVSEQRRLSQEIAWQASHDALTGLINRRELEQRLSRVLAQARSRNHQNALLYLDLDQFKLVNDTCGHFAGDQMLRQLALTLRSRVREEDTVARLGGDEFGVLLENCPLEDARRIAEDLRQTVQDFRFVWEDKSFRAGVSIGVVAVNDHSQSLEQVLVAADATCYAAKDKGRNRVWVHRPDDDEVARRHGEMQWVSRINLAVEQGRLCLYAQPIVPLRSAGDGLHFEVLLRMHDEQGRLVLPMAFIPAAERYGLMTMLDRWVVRKALGESLLHFGQGASGLDTIAINLSGASLADESLPEYMREQFALYAVPPEKICLEITETAAIANLAQARRVIATLQALGCRFALDDFGCGMSSFTYLKNLPVDYLKIDGSFVKDMLKDPIDRAMVQAINDIGHVMGIHTIAEFVDGEATVAMLRAMGVDYAQGFGIAAPEPLAELLARSSAGAAPRALRAGL